MSDYIRATDFGRTPGDDVQNASHHERPIGLRRTARVYITLGMTG